MSQTIEGISQVYDCTAEFVEFTGPSFPVYNEPVNSAIAKEAAENVVAQDHVVEVSVGMGSESFSTLSAFYPSSFLRIGVGNEEKGITASAHQSDFDIDEEGLPYGTALYCSLALTYLSKKRDVPADFQAFEGDIDDFRKAANRPVPKRYDQ